MNVTDEACVAAMMAWVENNPRDWDIICGIQTASPWKCFSIAIDLLKAGYGELTVMMISKSLSLMGDDETEELLKRLKEIRNGD